MSKVLFDPVMNRWLNYHDDNVARYNSIFREGYDDPTYLTFKIEFGDWGASVLDRSVVNLGTTKFQVRHADYDLLPMGLLNCPAPGDSHDKHVWQNGADDDYNIFNNIPDYSAFTYLRSRNEDTRAEYLYHFVNGLMEIQANTPYIFKRINGLGTLQLFDPKAGQRLKDAKITLDCYEGIDLKMKTLMELYRKAAYDEVYQRWILPENMREFKMIIYVFERRTFQDSYFGIDDLNYDIPIKAFECAPCEFDLTPQLWAESLDTTWESNTPVETLISIKVKNVKTYYKNGLINATLHNDYALTDGTTLSTKVMSYDDWAQINKGGTKDQYKEYTALHADMNNLNSRIDPILIYDLVESAERACSLDIASNFDTTGIANSLLTVNGVRGMFMNKGVLLLNEEFAGISPHKRTWVTSMVSAPAWSTELNFWQNLWSVAKQLVRNANRQIMIGGDSNLLTDKITSDILYYLLPLTDDYSYISAACIDANDPERASKLAYIIGNEHAADSLMQVSLISGLLGLAIRGNATISNDGITRTEKLINVMADTTIVRIDNGLARGTKTNEFRGPSNKEEQETTNGLMYMSDYKHVVDLNLVPLDPDAEPVDQQMELLIDDREHVDQDMNIITYEKEEVEQKMQKMEKSRKIPTGDEMSLTQSRLHADQDPLTIDYNKKVVDQEMLALDYYVARKESDGSDMFKPTGTDKTAKMLALEISKERTIDPFQTAKLENGRKLSDEKLKTLEDSREITLGKFQEMESLRDLPDLAFPSILAKREVPHSIEEIVMAVRKLPGFEKFTIDDALLLPKLELKSLEKEGFRKVPLYVADKNVLREKVETASTDLPQEFVRLDKELGKEELTAMETLRKNTALFEMSIKDSEPDAKNKQTILEIAKIYAENAPEIHKTLTEEIISMRKDLLELSKNTISELPEVDLYTISDNANKVNEEVMLTLDDVRQLDTNSLLIGLTDEKLSGMSITTLVSLYGKYVEEIEHTLQSFVSLKLPEIQEHEEKALLIHLEEKKTEKKRRKKLGSTSMKSMKEIPSRNNDNKIVY